GNIGFHVIRIARGFGMRVLAFDLRPGEFMADVLGFSYVAFDRLLAESDIVTLHIPLNRNTYHLINRETIGKMKDGAILINTARGAIVDTAALIEALDRKKLGGAGLDVIEGEELIKEEEQLFFDEDKVSMLADIARGHILLRKDNVVYTPHIGFFSQEALMKISQRTVENIRSFIAGRPQHDVTGIVESRRAAPVR
ncbi:MAG: hydroxyacid dehydrogenase, partial [Dehalococcoidia bacterium]|nr:hydroxyacid dehydrogenase [Dehalococcoidia bacterium]